MLETIVGKRGRGKTTLAKQLLQDRQALGQADQIFILDYLGEYSKFSSRTVYIQNIGLKSFCHKVWDDSGPKKSTLVLFDEIDLYGKDDFRIAHLYKFGRHKNIDIIAVARRFYDLPVIVRALTDEFHLFQITEERDLSYLRRIVSEPILQNLINLKPFHYINVSI
jgi:GTPase SAR1 family protein